MSSVAAEKACDGVEPRGARRCVEHTVSTSTVPLLLVTEENAEDLRPQRRIAKSISTPAAMTLPCVRRQRCRQHKTSRPILSECPALSAEHSWHYQFRLPVDGLIER
jgi:hypothetical protein